MSLRTSAACYLPSLHTASCLRRPAIVSGRLAVAARFAIIPEERASRSLGPTPTSILVRPRQPGPTTPHQPVNACPQATLAVHRALSQTNAPPPIGPPLSFSTLDGSFSSSSVALAPASPGCTQCMCNNLSKSCQMVTLATASWNRPAPLIRRVSSRAPRPPRPPVPRPSHWLARLLHPTPPPAKQLLTTTTNRCLRRPTTARCTATAAIARPEAQSLA